MEYGKSQVQRIQKIGLPAWLDEPVRLDQVYVKPSKVPSLFGDLTFNLSHTWWLIVLALVVGCWLGG